MFESDSETQHPAMMNCLARIKFKEALNERVEVQTKCTYPLFLQLKYSEMNPFTSPHMNSWPRFVNEGNICTEQFKMKALLLFDWITKFEFCRL